MYIFVVRHALRKLTIGKIKLSDFFTNSVLKTVSLHENIQAAKSNLFSKQAGNVHGIPSSNPHSYDPASSSLYWIVSQSR